MQVEENKTVDIDTSGPDTEVELKEDQTTDTAPVEETEEPVVAETQEASSEPQEASSEQQEATKKEEKKDELEQYSESVQKRIAKLTKKMREAERQKEEAIKFAQTQKEQKEDLEKRYSTLNTSSFETKEISIKSGIEAAKAKLATAREAGDMQAEIEAQQAVAQLAYAQAELDNQKKVMEQQAKEPKVEQKTLEQAVAPQRPDPKAEAWAEKNSWFGQDEAMTYTAMGLHKRLTEQEGFDPRSEEYYAEIDKRIKLEFPHKFAKQESTETAKPVQQVASATRSTKTGRKTVRLTPSQVAIAKKLGVPLEEYAKQLKLTKEV
jgi:chromosome segregation ATPase